MALLDITNANVQPVLFFNRGNIGTLVDIVAQKLDSLKTPLITPGGGGDEVSFGVFAG